MVVVDAFLYHTHTRRRWKLLLFLVTYLTPFWMDRLNEREKAKMERAYRHYHLLLSKQRDNEHATAQKCYVEKNREW